MRDGGRAAGMQIAPAVCAMASRSETPGMIGMSGKWPSEMRLVDA